MSVLPSADQKAAYVNQMFGGIAEHYDRMNRLMTLGQDVRWRKLLVHSPYCPRAGGCWTSLPEPVTSASKRCNKRRIFA